MLMHHGYFVSWLSKNSDVYAVNMPGNRYDIGNIESYNLVNETFNRKT